MQYNIPATRVVPDSVPAKRCEGLEAYNSEGSILDDDSAKGTEDDSMTGPQMMSRVSATLMGPGLHGHANMAAFSRMSTRDYASAAFGSGGAVRSRDGPLAESTDVDPLGVPSGVFATGRRVISALVNAEVDMPRLPRPSSPATSARQQPAGDSHRRTNAELLREISDHLKRAASVEPGRPWHVGVYPNAASPRDQMDVPAGSPRMASAFPLPSSPQLSHRHLVIPASPPAKHRATALHQPSSHRFLGTSHCNPLASLGSEGGSSSTSPNHHSRSPLDSLRQTQQEATLDQSFSEENNGRGRKSPDSCFVRGNVPCGIDCEVPWVLKAGSHLQSYGQPLGEASEAKAPIETGPSDGGVHVSKCKL